MLPISLNLSLVVVVILQTIVDSLQTVENYDDTFYLAGCVRDQFEIGKYDKCSRQTTKKRGFLKDYPQTNNIF